MNDGFGIRTCIVDDLTGLLKFLRGFVPLDLHGFAHVVVIRSPTVEFTDEFLTLQKRPSRLNFCSVFALVVQRFDHQIDGWKMMITVQEGEQ